MGLKNVHGVIKFNETAWLKPYIDTNTDPKKQTMNLKKVLLGWWIMQFLEKLWKIWGNIEILKSDSHIPKRNVICFIEDSVKMMKNAFYFNLKALFLFKTFSFLSWLFSHAGKMAWLYR